MRWLLALWLTLSFAHAQSAESTLFAWGAWYQQKGFTFKGCGELLVDFYMRQGIQLPKSLEHFPTPSRLAPGDVVFLRQTKSEAACPALYLGSGWLMLVKQRQVTVVASQEVKVRYFAARRVAQLPNTPPMVRYDNGPFSWPLGRFVVTTWYGGSTPYQKFHTGLDLAAPAGTPIFASRAGYVQDAGWSRVGYGLHVVIDHGDAFATWYGHMSKMAVNPGQYVQQGELIGYVGSTGWSTGPHLHFELRHANHSTDPLRYMPTGLMGFDKGVAHPSWAS